MTDATRRDWAADLALCEAFSRGRLQQPGEHVMETPSRKAREDRDFAAAARTGWPVALREAMKVEGLEATVDRLTRERDEARKLEGVDVARYCRARVDLDAALYDAAALRECLRDALEIPRSCGCDECSALIARAEALLAAKPKEEVGK